MRSCSTLAALTQIFKMSRLVQNLRGVWIIPSCVFYGTKGHAFHRELDVDFATHRFQTSGPLSSELCFLSGFHQGFRIGFQPNVKKLKSASSNCPSALEQSNIIDEYSTTEIQAGRVLGPLPTPPLSYLMLAGLASFPRKTKSMHGVLFLTYLILWDIVLTTESTKMNFPSLIAKSVTLSPVCAQSLHTIQNAANDIGIPLAPEKIEGPSTCLTFLGLNLIQIKWLLVYLLTNCQTY